MPAGCTDLCTSESQGLCYGSEEMWVQIPAQIPTSYGHQASLEPLGVPTSSSLKLKGKLLWRRLVMQIKQDNVMLLIELASATHTGRITAVIPECGPRCTAVDEIPLAGPATWE